MKSRRLVFQVSPTGGDLEGAYAKFLPAFTIP
jgi:hypothetical protein